MKQQLMQFLLDLSNIFPISSTRNCEKVIEQYTDYLLEFCYNKEIDFKRVTRAIIDDYKKQYFPEPLFIKDHLVYGEKQSYQKDVNEGKLLIVTLPNGVQYRFNYCGCGKTQKEIKASLMEKYGDCKYELYPAGTIIIGDKIF